MPRRHEGRGEHGASVCPRHQVAEGEQKLRAHHDHDWRPQPGRRAHSAGASLFLHLTNLGGLTVFRADRWSSTGSTLPVVTISMWLRSEAISSTGALRSAGD